MKLPAQVTAAAMLSICACTPFKALPDGSSNGGSDAGVEHAITTDSQVDAPDNGTVDALLGGSGSGGAMGGASGGAGGGAGGADGSAGGTSGGTGESGAGGGAGFTGAGGNTGGRMGGRGGGQAGSAGASGGRGGTGSGGSGTGGSGTGGSSEGSGGRGTGGSGGTRTGGSGSGGLGSGGSGTGGSCATGLTNCSGTCVDTQTSNAHCGRCGGGCSTAEICYLGSCRLRDGQACALPADCASGTCNTFLRDEDGDGYGALTSTIGRCTVTTSPAGYVSVGGDCCDNGGNLIMAAKIHPGVEFQTVSAGGICGITWDWNCSGQIDLGPDFDISTVCEDRVQCVSVSRRNAETPSMYCGMGYFACFCVMVGPPANTCTGSCNGPPAGSPDYRVFTCR